MLPFHAAAGSAEKRLLWYEGDVGVSLQRVGMLVGRNAHERLWPQLADWMLAQARAPQSAADAGKAPGSGPADIPDLLRA